MCDLVNQPIRLRVVAGHEVIAIGVARNALDRLARMVREQMIQPFLQIQDFARLDFDVRRLTARAAERLMNHHARIRQRETLALRTGRQQECAAREQRAGGSEMAA